jgi:hypothetical protein
MTKQLLALALACALSSLSPIALAGKPCPWNDKQLPEQSRVCKAGTMQQCKDGQWESTGIKCTARLREGDRADVLGARDRIIARIAPAS